MKRRRESAGTEVLYGRQPVREMLLAARRTCGRICVAPSARRTDELDEIRQLAEAAGAELYAGDPGELAPGVAGTHHQGVAAIVSSYPYVDFDAVRQSIGESTAPAFVLLLDHIQDPQNLGSILRTAEAAGVDSLLIPTDRAAGVTPAAVRASSGAAEHMRVARVTNLVRCMKSLKEDGLWLSGLEDTPESKPFTASDLSGPVGIVVGGEGKGLGRLVGETCDFLISLPMHGQVSSLNAGVATGIALYEVLRQRETGG